jgi:glucokinase
LRYGGVSSLRVLTGGEIDQVDATLVARAARDGDQLAAQVLAEAFEYLGIGVTNAIHAFDPQLVIIGGGVSRVGTVLFSTVARVVRERAMPAYRNGVIVLPAALGDDSGLWGAAALISTELGYSGK